MSFIFEGKTLYKEHIYNGSNKNMLLYFFSRKTIFSPILSLKELIYSF